MRKIRGTAAADNVRVVQEDLPVPGRVGDRYGNPVGKTVERKLAVLERGEEAVLYASGMTAIAGLLLRVRS